MYTETNLHYDADYIDEGQVVETSALANPVATWFKYIVIALIILVPVLIVCFAPASRWGTAFFAFINCIIYSTFAVRFLRKATLGYLIPLLAPLWLVIGSCIGIIYFAIFFPYETYRTMSGSISFFAGGIRYQLAICIFLLTYLFSMNWLLRKEINVIQSPQMVSRRVAYLSIIVIVGVVSIEIICSFLPFPLFISFWAGRFFTRYQTLLFIAGAAILVLPIVSKLWLVVFLLTMTFFYVLRNARAMALVPLVAFFCGLFFFSQIKTRTKLTLAIAIIIGLPFFLMISNTVRTLLGPGSQQASVEQKLSALKDWREAAKRWHLGMGFFGRMYFTAGNTIVAYTPLLYHYKHPVPLKYAREFAIYMLPDQIIRRVKGISDRTTKLAVLMQTEYTGTWLLRDYGMEVIETSSVETSTIGHFWMLGGYPFVFLGGIAVALVHGFAAWVIRRAWLKNPDKGIFYFAVLFYPFVWTMNWDFIQLWRNIFWGLIYAFVGFKLISPFLNSGETMAIEENNMEVY